MMTDTELVALAAKALGEAPAGFDPLESDADSRLLEVTLGLCVTPYPIYSTPKHSVIVVQHRPGDMDRESNPTETVEVYGDDARAATRRAVALCAALCALSDSAARVALADAPAPAPSPSPYIGMRMGHPDGDYSYLCGNEYCRCAQ